jgi:hypothetical protein
MRKFSLITAILLLCSAWMVAQSSPPSAEQQPASPQAQQPDKSQAAASDQAGRTVEGCLSGAANTFKLTDANGKTYELTGDTSGLNENVGHQVRLWGNAGSSGGGERISAGGAQATFGVTKVQSISPTCGK